MKTFGDAQGVSVNGLTSAATTGTTNFTAYISPYTVIGNGGQMSKHIYIGSQRVISKLIDGGTMSDPTVAPKAGSVDFNSKYTDLVNKMKVRYDSLGVTYRGTDNRSLFYKQVNLPDRENQQYFYHSDHLGSSSLVTDLSGNVAQHIEYVPFGEVFVEERNNSWSTLYKFNAKELDEETGLYYYGARYYNPRSSVWLSVDPLAEKYPNVSSYVYCLDNPIKFVDPNGQFPWVPAILTYFAVAKTLENSNGNYELRQVGYAMQHPINAYHVKNNLGVVAGNFQINIGRAIGAPKNESGTPQNAIRHTLWQALSARDLGGDQARRAANSHEETTNVDLRLRYFKKLEDADRTIDLLNNIIGRSIGEKNKDADNITIAKKVMEEYHDNGLWTAKPNEYGGYTIEKNKLTDEQYNAAIKEIDRKGENGLNKSSNGKN